MNKVMATPTVQIDNNHGIFSAWGVTRKFFGLLLSYRWGSLLRVGILWSRWYLVVHLWSYADFSERSRLRGALSKNSRWTGEYLPLIRPLMMRQDTVTMFRYPTFTANPK